MTCVTSMGAKVAHWYHTRLPPLRSAIQTPDSMWEIWYLLTDDQQFTVQNLDLLYVLISSAKKKPTHHDMTYTVLKATLKQINIVNSMSLLGECINIGVITLKYLFKSKKYQIYFISPITYIRGGANNMTLTHWLNFKKWYSETFYIQ